MDIKVKTSYVMNGKEYRTTTEAKNKVIDDIGAIIDRLNPRLPPKQALALVDHIISNRAELIDLLSSEFHPDDHKEPAISIFIVG